ncbi:MAG: anti-sigma factor antagonist [Pontiellaceae bacterium]|nr:anti-sigma factor antagonist [Pontiellaceae bacterium]MBN2784631.1 anti-sigma factor antagonist [Pontiellaceae bacterium]
MDEGRVMYAETTGIYLIQLIGNVRYTISRGLDKLINRISRDENAREIIIDLADTQFMDSTNLGLLAKLATVSHEKFNTYPLLISNNRNINLILDSMGFQQIFRMTSGRATSASSPLRFQDISDPGSPSANILLEAHRQLSGMNAKNAETFHDVIELLTEDSAV